MSIMHKRYKRIDGVGTLFLIFGIAVFGLTLVLNVFASKEYIQPIAFISQFSIIYGSFISIYTTWFGYNYSTGLCKCSDKCSKAFWDYCVNSNILCQNCNLSLLRTSSKKIPNETDWRSLAKLGYEIGLINEKEL